ncbi:hypothetical protein [Bacillus cereus]|uniref:hypothetical protein n=1 Tax=Bacillus cereus TaxID=1396 RepID=UPI000BFB811C|nr:hypothetical protein [Bacillus cereus]PGW89961.1 hypothetical protein COE32_24545 [Bacillus cereus]
MNSLYLLNSAPSQPTLLSLLPILSPILVAIISIFFNFKMSSRAAKISKDIELMKISQSHLQTLKTKTYQELIETLASSIRNPNKLQNMNQKNLNEFKERMMILGSNLFLFASDETINLFIKWRTHQTTPENTGEHVLEIVAQLVLSFRKDLGYQDTILNTDNYLSIIINDWENEKKKLFQQREEPIA